MRPHLPLKLRSALLAALVAVSFTVYSPAFAEEEEGDENTLTENKVYEHEETWTERITSFLTLDSYKEINISNMPAVFRGGAVYLSSSSVKVAITNSGNIFFENNTASDSYSSYGGAIYNAGTLGFDSNGDITFSDNSAASSYYSSYGGAIYNAGTLTFDSNADITFSGNSSSADSSAGYADARGGAIYNKDTLTFASNADITFSGNSSAADSSAGFADAYGGAIYNEGTLTFASNADITFSGNSNSDSGSVSGYGGAIYNDTSSSQLSFYDNSSVLFEKNYTKGGYNRILRSIVSSYGSLYLAAKEGGYITFKDSIYSSGACTFNAYLDENGGLITSFGEIIFTGESTESDLVEIMGSTPTASQITTSRTSELCKATTLYGGTLSIREQAILKGVGLTVQTSATEGGTRVLLNNGILSMADKSITFQSGTVLEAQGASSVSGNITMAANSTLLFTPSAADTPILTLTGTLVQEGNLLISIAGNAAVGTYTLLSVSEAFDIGNWTEARVSVTGAEYCDLRWDTQGKNLYLDYKGASGLATDVVWNGGSGAWNSFAKNWQAGANASQFVNGMNVRFTDAGAGSVSITENLAPGSITVENRAGNDYTFFGTGRISGSASLTKQGQGTLTINNANSYTGDTRIDGGTLVIGHAEALGHGVVTLIDGTLDIGGFRPHNDFVLNGGKVVLRETEGGLQIGKLTIVGNEVAIDYGDLSDHLTGESYTLAMLESGSTGDGSKLTLVNSNLASGYSFEIKDDALVLNLEKRDATTLTWNAKQSTWGQRAEGDLWQTPSGVNDGHFHNGDTVVIAVVDDITVAGTVNPAAVKVQAASGTVRLGGSGSITGNGTLYKSGNSTLVLDTANSYTGGTVVEVGVLKLGGAFALGSGRVTLCGGTLDMGGLAVNNTVQIGKDALATIVNGENYAGTARLSGGTLYLKGAFGGDLILNGGLLDLTGLDSMQLGAVMTSSLTQINVGDISGFGEGAHTLLTFADGSGLNTSLLQIVGMDSITDLSAMLEMQDNELVLVLSKGGVVIPPVPDNDLVLDGEDKVLDDEVTPDHIEIGGDDDSTITGGGSIAGDGDLDKDGKGDLTIDTENPDWSGDININDGTVIAGNENALGTGDVNLNGGDLDMGGNSIGNDINVNTDATINGGENYQGELTLNDGTVNGGTINLGQDATVNNGTINNDLTGTGGINKETDGTVTLGGDNSFKGDVNVNDGTLIAGTDTALGTGDVNLNGGDLDLGGNSIGNDINVNTDATINGGEHYQGELTLNDGTVNGGTINLGQDATVNNGTINNDLTGDGGINKETDGTVTLGGDNSFKGDVNVNDGTLIAGSGTALGTGDVNLNGGDLDLGGNSIGNDINVNTDATINGGENYQGELTLNDGTVNGGTINLGQDATVNKGTINNDLTGEGGINKETDGTVTLGGDNSFKGDVNVNDGTLIAGSGTALGTGDVNLNGGTLNMGGWDLSNDIIVTQDSVLNGAGDYRGTLTLRNGTLTGGSINIADGKTFVLENGTLTNKLTGEGGIVKVTNGTVVLNGNNTFAGGATISAGTLTLGSATALGTGAVTLEGGTLNLGDKAAANAITAKGGTLGGASAYTGALTVNGNVTLGGTTKAGSITLVGGGLTGGSIADTAITANGGSISSVISGSSSMTSTGNVTLSGANTYTGGTSITGGTLTVGHASALGTGAVALNGTLDMGGLAVGNTVNIGSGSLATIVNGSNFAGTVNLNGGTLTLADTLGGALTLNGGVLDLSGMTAASLGTVTTSSLTQINVGDITGLTAGTHTLLTLANGAGIDTDLLQIVGMDGITEWNKALEIQGNDLVLVLSALTSPTDDIILGGGDKVLDDVVTPDHIEIGGDDDSTITGGGSIAGDGTLDKDGKGDLTIDTENPDWSGDININDGTVIAGNENALGTGDVNLNGGDLDLGGNSIGNDINVNTDATINGGENYQGGLTLNDGTVNGGTINLGQDATVNNGTINNDLTGDGGINKETDGTVTLGGNNDFKGDVNVNDGTLIAGSGTALGTGDVNLNGGDLDLGGNSIGNDINVNTDATINGGDHYQGGLTLNDGTVNGGTINLGQDATVNNGTINNDLTGEGGINKETDGTVTLGGDNSFKGGVNVNGGTLIAGTDTALGTGDVHLNGGTLNMGGWDLGNDIIVVQDSVLNGAGDYRGTLTLRNGVLAGGSINIAAGKTFVLENGTLSNKLTGEGGIVKVTNGTVVLNGNNTFTGGATISAGTLTLGSATALGTGTVTLEGGTLNLNSKAAANAITATGGTLSGASAYTGTLTIEGSVTLGGTTKAGSITLTTGSLTGGSIADTAITANGGSIASSITGGSIVNVTGDTSLSGANSYTGGTSISGGALLSVEHARALGNGAVSLQNGILDLGGMAVNNTVNIGKGELGTIVNGANYTGTVNLNGGTLNLTQALGGSITLNGGLLDLTGLSTMAVDATLSTVTLGTVTTSALTQINVGDVSGLVEGTYSLLSFADGRGIDTSLLQVAGLDSITGWNKALEIQGNDLVLVLSALATPTDDILLDGTNKVLEGIVTPGTIQVVGDGNSSITGSGSIAGDGTLDKTGNGTLTIDTENPDWNGVININGGTLIAGNGNALGTSDVHLNGGTLQLGGHGTSNDILANGGTLAGAENYNGWLTVDGNVTLAGTTHADGLTMESGILTGGSIHDTDITANGGWILSDITGKGSLTNTGDTTLFGDNSYNGGTTINCGTLTAAGENSLGTGDVTLNGGTLHLGGNGVGNNITVQGDSTLNGGGAYTGTLTLKGGTLTGDGINIAAGKTFVLENGTLSNKLTGEGGVSKVTDGTVTLGGANSYSGGTVINAGTLIAGNDKAFGTGSVTVNGGTLDINGKGVGNSILLNNGATLRGASSAKDITVAAGAGVNIAGHSINAGQTLTTLGGNSISGGITFNGGTIVMKTPNLTFTDVVTIAAGSVTTLDVSAFASTLDTDGLNTLISFDGGLENYTDGCLTLVGVDNTLTQTLTIDGSKLMLGLSTPTTPAPDVTPAYNADPATLGGNRSTVYKQLVDGNRNAELDGVMEALSQAVDNERDGERLKRTLDAINGVLYTTQMSAQIDGNRAALGTVRGMMGYGKPLCSRTDDWRFAVQATSANSSLDHRADAPGYTRRGFGAVLLAETMLDDGVVAGVSLGCEHAAVSVDGLDEWKSDDVRFNAHLLIAKDGWQSRTILGIGKHDYDVTRRLGIVDATATSSPSGMSINFMQEFSYMVALDEESTVEPFFRVESSFNTIDAISETGTAGNAALCIGKQEAWATTLTLGARYSQTFTMGSRLVLEAGVSKSIGAENDTLTMSFAGDPAHAYRLTPAGRDRCSATLGGSLLFPIGDSQSINVSGSMQLRSHQTDYNASVGYSITF